ncbi:MAG: hypothetical protein GF383_15310 [Candidatus Lokiarchaeota archaeon]|nr:hypothetical protein [Candidatus Lokiarchaeota archaeon]MBD3342912.1 hypothetical protein [Candidatus Lokiarchaeota archaeon]
MSVLEKNYKRSLIERIINSGINISPDVFNYLLKNEDPFNKIDVLIRESSFVASFESLLTSDILKKINNHEIKKWFKRFFKEAKNKPEKRSVVSQKIQKKEINGNFEKKILHKKSIEKKSHQHNINHKLDAKLQPKPQNVSHRPQMNDKHQNQSTNVKSYGSNKSTFRFKAKAKEYPSDYKILKDPTGKLFTSGEYDDFYQLTRSKFTQLARLMKKRSDARNSEDIVNIINKKPSDEITLLGLVTEIHPTKNGHYFLTIEDLTGTINVLIKNDPDYKTYLNLAKNTIQDQMVCVKGIYNEGKNGRSGIVFANSFTKIDIPHFSPKNSPDPLSIVLLSDLHIGSREFEPKLWSRFIKFVNGKVHNQNYREIAGRIKYVVINGDLVDGIGVYPEQKNDLIIDDIYEQFGKAAELLSQLPDYIQIFFSSGNHDPVRNAIPRPAVPKKYARDLEILGIKCLGNPATIRTHNVDTLIYHGDSMLDLNLLINELSNDDPAKTMKEMLRCRSLAPIFGNKTQIAPTPEDWLVINEVPEIFHTGHIHINGLSKYRNILLVNSGCFQAQTEFMKSFGIEPTPGIISLVELDSLRGMEIDLKKSI